MKSRYVADKELNIILCALMPANALAVEVSLATGLRIDDVLSLKADDVAKMDFTIKEMKTGKRKRVHLGKELVRDLLSIAGRVYVFEHRTDWRRHRTRQAVYKDVVRVARMLRLKGVTPHSARKVYAVRRYAEGRNLKRVQRLLNHSSEAVTMIYALADELSEKQHRSITKLSQK